MRSSVPAWAAGPWPWRFNGQVLKTANLSPLGMRVFDSLVWLFRRIDKSLPIPPTSIIAIARRPE